MSKSFLKIALLSVMFTTANSVFCQTKWHKEPLFSPLLEKAKLRTIGYKSTDDIAIGYVYKNQFLDGQNITFLSKQTQDTIISGRYYVAANLAYIDGVWKRNTENGVTRSYGIFQVKNADKDIAITIKPREGKPLQIETNDIFLYQGFRNKYPATLTKQDYNKYLLTVKYPDRQNEKDYYKIEMFVDKKLIDEKGFYAINDFVLYTTDVTRYYNNGSVFIGKVENTPSENNYMLSELREGKLTHTKGETDEEELTKLPDGNFKYKLVYSNRKPNNNMAQMEIIVIKSLIEKYDYWAVQDYIYNTPIVKYTYKNGNVFDGKQENKKDSVNANNIIINSKLTKGKLQYATGEVFEGDLSGQWFCGIPISGKMQFTGGSVENGNWLDKFSLSKENSIIPISGKMQFTDENIENGNWLEKFNLSKEDYMKVSEVESPSKKRNIAKNLYKETQYRSAIDKASLALSEKKYKTAKSWYLEALNFKSEENGFVNTQIEKIEKLIVEEEEKKPFIEKYGEYWGNLVYNGKYTLGMNISMVFDVLLKNNNVKTMEESLKIVVRSLKGMEISTKGIGSSMKDFYSIVTKKHGSQIVETFTFSKNKYIDNLEKVANRITDPEGQMKIKLVIEQVKQSFNYSLFGADPLKNQLPTFTFSDGKLSEIDYGFSNINIFGN